MARNVKWILDHAPPGTKIVLWAHNGHVNRVSRGSAKRMGSFLHEMYGDDMVVIGFACNSGEYTAIKRGEGLRSDNPLKPGDPGSVDYYFHKSGLPRFILDLREASADSAGSAWLTKPRYLRSIGALARDFQFSRVLVHQAFDALIYFDTTQPSRGLWVPNGN
jgi:erythromycin esterase